MVLVAQAIPSNNIGLQLLDSVASHDHKTRFLRAKRVAKFEEHIWVAFRDVKETDVCFAHHAGDFGHYMRVCEFVIGVAKLDPGTGEAAVERGSVFDSE
ncbi:MAG TPA: hypothetical protein VFE16_02450 [Candidatus Cybelea sp.]|nr:hypothetical protein [Candidatus Cybelea sp.]